MRKYHRTNVPSIHYNSFVFPHFLLLGYCKVTDFFNGGNITYFFSYNKVTNNILNVFTIEVYLALPRFVIREKFELYLFQGILYRFVFCPVNMISKKVQSNSTIHSAAVNVDI